MTYVRRLVDPLVEEILAEHPAVMIVGPRACGKTTSALRHAASELRLNRSNDAQLVRSDPDAALDQQPYPLLIDEWQMIPEVLSVVKQRVDESEGNGRFLLTGSFRADLTEQGWPMTGRVVRTTLWGLTTRELLGHTNGGSFFDRVLDAPAAPPPPAPEHVDTRQYVEYALRGGFPEAALKESERARTRFFDSYVDDIVRRDIPAVATRREPVKVLRYLKALAASTAGAPQHKRLYDAAEIERLTAVGFDDLLERLMIVERLPAWTSNRLDRLAHLPKRHITDPALLVALLGIDSRAVMRDADLLGRVIESYVVAQLRVEATISQRPPQLFHLRNANGDHEIDLIAEFPNGDVIAIEVKATTAPDLADARHLVWLEHRLGERLRASVVLHTGRHGFRLTPKILALPISSIWAPV